MALEWRWDGVGAKITSWRWNGAGMELDEDGLNGAEMAVELRWDRAGANLQVGAGMALGWSWMRLG